MSDIMRRLLLHEILRAPEGADAGAEVVMDEGADTGEVQEGAEGAGGAEAASGAKEGADTNAGGSGDSGEGSGDGKGEDGEGEGSETEQPKFSVALTDDVRDQIAGEDKDLRKLLGRYTSVKTLAQALKNAQGKIAKGPEKREMPDPTDAKAMAEWRKAEGIPDDPSGYELPETVKSRLTDADKPLISSFAEYAHKRGAKPDAVNLATEWYFDTMEAMDGERIAQDNEAKSKAEEELRADWGSEYKANLRLAASMVESIPGVGKDWSNARLPDGRRLGDIPDFVIWAAEQGRQTFGDAAFVSDDSQARHNNRRAEIEGIMKTDINRYYAEGLDKELAEILKREEKRRA